MKIWHQRLIRHLPAKLLMKLHADCCDMRASGWNTFREEMKYVFDGGRIRFTVYHMIVLDEIADRREKDGLPYRYTNWHIHNYRGPRLKYEEPDDRTFAKLRGECDSRGFVYAEHDDAVLLDDIRELKRYGVSLPELEIAVIAGGNAA